ncbi:Uncharacterised protein [uncultured archaeon]|nr:Uncharacterised protein [uncultured archaeon]
MENATLIQSSVPWSALSCAQGPLAEAPMGARPSLADALWQRLLGPLWEAI